MNSPLQVSRAMYLLTTFKQDLQDSASTVAVSGKDEAEGWCSDPQLLWVLTVCGRLIDLCLLPKRVLAARAGVEQAV